MIIQDLEFSYGENIIFQDLNFETNTPITGLTGPSGCGKTTLLKIIAGNLIPKKIQRDYSCSDTLLVVQEDSLLPWLDGMENIKFVLPEVIDTVQSHQLYPIVKSFLYNKSYQMSYGQRRLIEIFRAILAKPKFLLLDEPFNFLDKDYRKSIVDVLREMTQQSTQIIFSSHYNEDLSDLSAKVFYFNGQFPTSHLTPK